MMRGQKPWYKNWKIWLVIILILYIMGSANKPKTIENETEPVEWQQTRESEEVPKEEEQDTENQMDSEMKSYAGKPVGEVALPLYDSGRLSSMILGPTGATIWGPGAAHNTRDAIQNLADQGYIVTEAKSSDGQSVELVIDTTANVVSEQYSQQLLLAQGMASSSFEKLAPCGGEITGWVQTPRTEDGKSWYGIAEAKVKNQYGVEMSGEVKVHGTIDGDTVTLSGFDTLD